MATRKKILVVDDAPEIRTSISELLEAQGYEVTLADNGQTALAYLQEHGPVVGLILLDLSMPVMNGWEFLQQLDLHLNLSEIPVLILSGLDAPLPARALAVLRKPIKVRELVEKIARFSKKTAASPHQ